MAFNFNDEDLRLEKTSHTLKSQEELARFTVDETLFPIERALYVLSKGHDVQQISALRDLPELLTFDYSRCMNQVIPKIKQMFSSASEEFHLTAAEVFEKILKSKLVSSTEYVRMFLPSIMTGCTHKDAEFADAWLSALMNILDSLPPEAIEKHILTSPLARCQLSQSLHTRMACCRLLGKLASVCNPVQIRQIILPSVEALYQDVDLEVRLCMCQQLTLLAQTVGSIQACESILPKVVELAYDDNPVVKSAALETLCAIVPLLNNESRATVALSVFTEISKEAVACVFEVTVALATVYGTMCVALSADMTPDMRIRVFDTYKKLCRLGLRSVIEESRANAHSSLALTSASGFSLAADQSRHNLFAAMRDEREARGDFHVACRCNAAKCLPAMIVFSKSLVNARADVDSILSNFCVDPQVQVRAAVAGVFHEVIVSLGKDAGSIIQSEFITLLRDDCVEVAGGLVPGFTRTLTGLKTALSSREEKLTLMPQVAQAIVKCSTTLASSPNWRLQEDFVRQLSCLTTVYTSNEIHMKFIQHMFHLLHTLRALPVRRACVVTVLAMLRANTRGDQRNAMCKRLVEEFALSLNSYKRHLFVDICLSVFDMFSTSFFREHFFDSALELANDQVPNLRLRFCTLLPRLKEVISWLRNDDKNLGKKLEDIIRKLMIHEADNDVRAYLTKALDESHATDMAFDTADSRERRERDRAREAEDVTPFLEKKDGAINRGGACLNLKKEKSNVSEWKAPDAKYGAAKGGSISRESSTVAASTANRGAKPSVTTTEKKPTAMRNVAAPAVNSLQLPSSNAANGKPSTPNAGSRKPQLVIGRSKSPNPVKSNATDSLQVADINHSKSNNDIAPPGVANKSSQQNSQLSKKKSKTGNGS